MTSVAMLLGGAANAYAADDISAEVIFRGTFRSAFQKPLATDPPAPNVDLGSGWVGPRPRQETASVVGSKGLDFGLLFVPKGSKMRGAPVSLRYVTRFPGPGLLKPGSAERLTQADSEIRCLMGMACTARYTLDEEWEIIPGTWHFEIYDGTRKLLDETIEIQASGQS